MKDDLINTESKSIEDSEPNDEFEPEQPDVIPEDSSQDNVDVESTVDPTAIVKDQLLRTLAEFENYKKRTVREYQSVVQFANEKLLLELLPALDDLERALKVAKEMEVEDPKVQQSFQGFENIYKKLIRILGEKGLQPMESIGKELDVNLHDALMQVDADGQASNIIVDEHEKGYTLYDKVIRHAKVIVTK